MPDIFTILREQAATVQGGETCPIPEAMLINQPRRCKPFSCGSPSGRWSKATCRTLKASLRLALRRSLDAGNAETLAAIKNADCPCRR
ncbi:MAG: hypothetical protein IPK44_00585 [Candidatus Accumulibacter sp.]|uniref:hypothetical protein n=1 Tax=Accumulibacter sp. TaxID=2053492 RepID=UPI00258D7CCE|nr:hypothetical protein [Accumulibacter sp.]MBK8113102.1 hypothetical protein [Accumulibacter sp.]